MCNNIVDSHIHFPMKEKDPYIRLVDELHQSNVNNFLLILNKEDEINHYRLHYKEFEKEGLHAKVAVSLNPSLKDWRDRFNFFEDNVGDYTIKIHPRITGLTINDTEKVLEQIGYLNKKTVIVDDWIFGPNIENHIGTQLAIKIAQNYEDKKIVIAHSGGLRVLETMLLTRPLKNIYYDVALTCIYFNGTSVSLDLKHFLKYTYNRILFGSDYPDFSIKNALESFVQHCTECNLNNEIIRKMTSENAKKLFGF